MRCVKAVLPGLLLWLLAGGEAPAEEIAGSAAASLREVVGEIARGFERSPGGARVALAFGASNVLARQIAAGAPTDVFLSADEASVDVLEASGLVRPGTRAAFASNRLVVIEAGDLTPPLRAPADLARPGLRRIALAADGVPAGRYAREWLVRTGLWEAVAARALVLDDVRATLAAVDAGGADVGIVYATDARVAKRSRVAFVVPEAEQPRIVYVAAGIARRPGPPGRPGGPEGAEAGARAALADAFLRHLRAPASLEALRAAGFGPPPEGAGAAPVSP